MLCDQPGRLSLYSGCPDHSVPDIVVIVIFDMKVRILFIGYDVTIK